MTSITTSSAPSATPSGTPAKEPSDDRLVWVFIVCIFLTYGLVAWLCYAVYRRVERLCEVQRRVRVNRKRQLDWELYP
jgi:hypothetical protein